LRIALVARLFFRKAYRHLVNELGKRGHFIEVLCEMSSDFKDFYPQENINFHFFRGSGRGLGSRLAFNLFVTSTLKNLMSKHPLELVLIEQEGASGTLPRLYNLAPMVTYVTQCLPIFPLGKWERASFIKLVKSNLYTGAEASQLFFSDMILFESKSALDVFHPILQRIEKIRSRTYLIPQGVPTKLYKPMTQSNVEYIDVQDKRPLILAVPGTLSVWKGVVELLHTVPIIVERFPDSLFIIVGRTPPIVDKIVIEAVDNLIRSKYASHLKFLSNVPLSDLIKLYGAADLFVHASYFESSANVVLEAMASAKPAVITQTGLYKELSELSFGGTVTPVGNSFLLSKAIINMLSLDEQSKLNMGNINRQIVEQHFSVESWADRLEKVFQVLI